MRRVFVTASIVVVLGIVATAFSILTVPQVQDAVARRLIHAAFEHQRGDLVKNDALRVAICGSGSPIADPDRAPACNLVFADGKIFAVDVGPGSFERVARWRIPLEDLSAVLLTHFHSDHIGDLGEANLQSWVAGRPQPLAVYGGPGIEHVVAGFNEAYAMDDEHRIAHHGADFLPPELGKMQPRLIANADGSALTGMQSQVVYDRDGLRITAFAVEHPPVVPAYGYRFDFRGRSVVFSGDTHKSANLARVAENADLLIHEAMLKDIVHVMYGEALAAHLDRQAHILHDIPSYHASPVDAAETAHDAHVAHLVLSHLIPPVPSWLGDRLFLRGTNLPGVDVHVAYDGMLIEMPLGTKTIDFSDLGR